MALNICPLCKKDGDSVKRITVEHLVNNYFKKHLKSYEYGLCLNPDCDVVYFNNEKDEIYFQRDVSVPVWYKNEPNPIICYCGNVTMQDIINEIVIKKTSNSLEDIIKNTNAMKFSRCKTTNPSGKCCKESLEKAVNYALSLREKNDLEKK